MADDDLVYLTPHFTLDEFCASDTADACGITNEPTAEALTQLTLTAEMMEKVRTLCGNFPVVISSGYRCTELNAQIGGAANSAHMYGCACDFTIPDYANPLSICLTLEPHLAELGCDQLINEADSWVHIGRPIPPSTAPRYQCLTIVDGVTTTGFA
jgi:zinc D-Ala-D-Ala carboxypeptidase